MWMLLIILLDTVPQISTVTVLQIYATSQECQSERTRVGYQMAEAYPYERDFVIACQFNPRQQS
jgi:hypothetical protein